MNDSEALMAACWNLILEFFKAVLFALMLSKNAGFIECLVKFVVVWPISCYYAYMHIFFQIRNFINYGLNIAHMICQVY